MILGQVTVAIGKLNCESIEISGAPLEELLEKTVEGSISLFGSSSVNEPFSTVAETRNCLFSEILQRFAVEAVPNQTPLFCL